MPLAAEVSPTWILEVFEAVVPRARPSALYAVEAWDVPSPRKLPASFAPLDIEAYKA